MVNLFKDPAGKIPLSYEEYNALIEGDCKGEVWLCESDEEKRDSFGGANIILDADEARDLVNDDLTPEEVSDQPDERITFQFNQGKRIISSDDYWDIVYRLK
jgi:hypothetical protein